MITRKQGKIITYDEFLSKQPGNIVSCDIENILCGYYVYLLDSMDMEDFEYEDTSFDIFKEIVYKNKVVGFVSYILEDTKLILMESYIMPEYRDKNLLHDEISSNSKLAIHKPKIDFVKSLIECNFATELSEGIVVSEIPFNISDYDLIKSEEYSFFESYVFDLNKGSVLLLKEEMFNYSQPHMNDIKKYGLNENIDDDYLNKAYEIVSNYDKKYLKISSRKPNLTIALI